MNKKAAIHILVELVFAILLVFLGGLILNILSVNIVDVNIAESELGSRACEPYLFNFMNLKENNQKMSELLVENPANFQNKAEQYFNKLCAKRPQPAYWRINTTDLDFGNVSELPENEITLKNSCKYFVPIGNEEVIEVKLIMNR